MRRMFKNRWAVAALVVFGICVVAVALTHPVAFAMGAAAMTAALYI